MHLQDAGPNSALLLPGEDPATYAASLDRLASRYPTADPTFLAELASLQWRRNRLPAFEAGILALEIREIGQSAEFGELSAAEVRSLAFQRLIERKVLQALHTLETRLTRRIENLVKLLKSHESLPAEPEIIPAPAILQNEPNLPVRSSKIGRNEPCPCHSGLKYKRCCLNKPPLNPAGSGIGKRLV